jgi:excinuclease ABC subunit A
MAGTIVIRGARVHNLKNINLEIPRDKLVIVTGLSGSGKSSLAFDTLYAEGQRRYLESLALDARQFVRQLERPDVDSIEGLSPAIAIQQKSGAFTSRSTVGTITEIYDYLRLLFARIGRARCMGCGREIVAHSIEQIVDELLSLPQEKRALLLAPAGLAENGGQGDRLAELMRAGFTRVKLGGKIQELSEVPETGPAAAQSAEVVVDRLVLRPGIEKRLADSLEIAARVGNGVVKVELLADKAAAPEEVLTFSTQFTCPHCGLSLPEITPRLFSFNSPQGACAACGGLGFIHKNGRAGAGGADEDEAEPCATCRGSRLKAESLMVKIGSLSIADLASLSIEEAIEFLAGLNLQGRERAIGKKVLDEIIGRMEFLKQVGLQYLSLDRPSKSLSGGEAQRVRLATQIGSGLAGVLYILDEPSIGLHQKDNARLLALLKLLKERGNSLVIVEHDEETIAAADHIIDMGPGAGIHGGEVVAHGSLHEVMRNDRSLTGQYLARRLEIPVPPQRRPGQGSIVLTGARAHNLKNLTVRIPVAAMTCVTGVSGSGKSSLVVDTLYRALAARLHGSKMHAGAFARLSGWENIQRIVGVDQSPIGRTPKSTPATYTGIHDHLRDLFAQLPEARVRGYKAARFSFNARGGRCETCAGDGVVRVDMYFLPEVFVPCDVCKGRRYNRETLEIKYKGLSIADVLDLTVAQALDLLNHIPAIHDRLRSLQDVGLGYLRLGQSASTLSGGEGQRVKLARELARRSPGGTLYILDEPTTGLHFDDVRRLLDLLHRLVDMGNTAVVIEHNLDVIKTADYVIDLGPEGGAKGGELIAIGAPEAIASVNASVTGQYLRSKLGLSN